MGNPCNSKGHSWSAGVQMQRKQGCSQALLNLKEAMVSGQFTTNQEKITSVTNPTLSQQ